MQPGTSPGLRKDGVRACRRVSFLGGRHRLDPVDIGPLLPCGRRRERAVPLQRQLQCRLGTYQPVRTSMRPVSLLSSSGLWRPLALTAVTTND
jgi:hypothetical protein